MSVNDYQVIQSGRRADIEGEAKNEADLALTDVNGGPTTPSSTTYDFRRNLSLTSQLITDIYLSSI